MHNGHHLKALMFQQLGQVGRACNIHAQAQLAQLSWHPKLKNCIRPLSLSLFFCSFICAAQTPTIPTSPVIWNDNYQTDLSFDTDSPTIDVSIVPNCSSSSFCGATGTVTLYEGSQVIQATTIRPILFGFRSPIHAFTNWIGLVGTAGPGYDTDGTGHTLSNRPSPDGVTSISTISAIADTNVIYDLPVNQFIDQDTVTAGVWVKSDSPAACAAFSISIGSSSQTIPITNTWQRVTTVQTIQDPSDTEVTSYSLFIPAGCTLSYWGSQVSDAFYTSTYLPTLSTGAIDSGNLPVASFPLSSLSAGTHTFFVTYSGDGSNLPSTSEPLTIIVSPPSSSVLTSVTLSPSSTSSPLGTPVSLTATPSLSIATGEVLLVNEATDQVIAHSDVISGTAAFSVSSLPAGTTMIHADYLPGDSTYAFSKSQSSAVTVYAPTPSTITLTPLTGSIAQGSSTPIIATVSPSSATGAVTLWDEGTNPPTFVSGNILSSGATPLTTTLSLSTLLPGVHSLHATYAGDANNAPSTSPSVSVTVNTSFRITGITPSAGLPGQPVKLAGANFASTQEKHIYWNGVQLNDSLITSWLNAEIDFIVPDSAKTAVVQVWIGGYKSNGVLFIVSADSTSCH